MQEAREQGLGPFQHSISLSFGLPFRAATLGENRFDESSGVYVAYPVVLVRAPKKVGV